MQHAKVIVNPVAGANSTHRKWPLISRLLKHIGLSFDYQFTEGVGHAIELARDAASDGYRYLVAVGGDGTMNEVANGILYSTSPGETSLGMVSTGTGSDFVRSLGIPRDYTGACSCLTSSGRLLIDVGVVEYQSQGKTAQRFFINAAGVGFDAEVVKATGCLPKYFGGTIPYLAGLFMALVGYHNKPVSITAGGKTESRRILTVVVANGRYFGGGMHIAPEADFSDSLLDLVVIGDMSKFDLLRSLSSVYKGTHVTHPKFSMTRAAHVKIDSPERFLVHADGELLGEGPVSFRLLPSALRIVAQNQSTFSP